MQLKTFRASEEIAKRADKLIPKLKGIQQFRILSPTIKRSQVLRLALDLGIKALEDSVLMAGDIHDGVDLLGGGGKGN